MKSQLSSLEFHLRVKVSLFHVLNEELAFFLIQLLDMRIFFLFAGNEFFPQSWFYLFCFFFTIEVFLEYGLRNLYAVTLSEKMAKFHGGKENKTKFTLRLHNVFIQEHGMRKRPRMDLLSV